MLRTAAQGQEEQSRTEHRNQNCEGKTSPLQAEAKNENKPPRLGGDVATPWPFETLRWGGERGGTSKRHRPAGSPGLLTAEALLLPGAPSPHRRGASPPRVVPPQHPAGRGSCRLPPPLWHRQAREPPGAARRRRAAGGKPPAPAARRGFPGWLYGKDGPRGRRRRRGPRFLRRGRLASPKGASRPGRAGFDEFGRGLGEARRACEGEGRKPRGVRVGGGRQGSRGAGKLMSPEKFRRKCIIAGLSQKKGWQPGGESGRGGRYPNCKKLHPSGATQPTAGGAAPREWGVGRGSCRPGAAEVWETCLRQAQRAWVPGERGEPMPPKADAAESQVAWRQNLVPDAS